MDHFSHLFDVIFLPKINEKEAADGSFNQNICDSITQAFNMNSKVRFSKKVTESVCHADDGDKKVCFFNRNSCADGNVGQKDERDVEAEHDDEVAETGQMWTRNVQVLG